MMPGKTGVEGSFEDELHGDVGVRHVVSNALGRRIPTDSREMADSLPADESPSPGMNVYLSLDLELQRIATEALEGRRGAVVAIDPWTGEILALVSAPTFDPNLFAVGMSTAQFNALQNNLDRPLFNLEQFESFRGEIARVTLFAPLEGRRKFKGRILGTANDKVQLDQDGTEVELEPGNIAKARLVPDYDSLFTKREEAR